MTQDLTKQLRTMTVEQTVPYLITKVPVGTPIKSEETQVLPKLFTPLKIKNLELHNRIGVSPMCQYSAVEGVAGDYHQMHYKALLIRGPGITFTEANAVVPEGRISPNDLGMYTDEQARAMANIVSFAHSQKQLIGIQLAHAGRKASTLPPGFGFNLPADKSQGGWPDNTYCTTAMPFTEKSIVPKALTEEQIGDIVTAFAQSAQRAVEIAKFDAVEIHGAHGYLVHSFLSPFTNRRTDKYGGSFENRIRFLLEIVEGIKKVIPDTVLSVRLSAVENVDNEPLSWTLEETVKLSKLLVEEYGVDIIDVSSGGNNPAQHMRGLVKGMHVPYSTVIKEAIGDKGLVSVVGAMEGGEYCNQVLDEGKADLILVGRGFLKNPALVSTWANELKVKVKSAPQYSRAY